MKTKNYLLWMLAIPVGLAFITTSVLVFLNKGNNRKLVRAKLKTGAFLLSVSYFSACGHSGGGPEIMCYDPALPENYISINWPDSVYQPGDSIEGGVNMPSFKQYSFAFYKAGNNDTTAAGWLVADDKKFDGSYETFKFEVPKRMTAGEYELKIFGEPGLDYSFQNLFLSRRIKIGDENGN
jgi:hypothetical protein